MTSDESFAVAPDKSWFRMTKSTGQILRLRCAPLRMTDNIGCQFRPKAQGVTIFYLLLTIYYLATAISVAKELRRVNVNSVVSTKSAGSCAGKLGI